eukprot:8184803-Pyramimonas_sp.AAC.2
MEKVVKCTPWSQLSTVGKKSTVKSTVMNQSRLLGRPSRPEVDCWVDRLEARSTVGSTRGSMSTLGPEN